MKNVVWNSEKRELGLLYTLIMVKFRSYKGYYTILFSFVYVW